MTLMGTGIAGLLVRLRRMVKSCRALREEDGATMVEMAVSLTVLVGAIFLVIQMCFVLYAYNAVSEAAREATRYAAVRGSNSCSVLSTFPNCNLGPTTTGNPLQTVVQGFGYPISGGMTVTATWWGPPSVDTNGSTSWPTQCTTLQDTNNNYCNQAGNQVNVVVSYTVSLPIPFVSNGPALFNVHSTSQTEILE
jgi:Flp pilus assembly protein TadG